MATGTSLDFYFDTESYDFSVVSKIVSYTQWIEGTTVAYYYTYKAYPSTGSYSTSAGYGTTKDETGSSVTLQADGSDWVVDYTSDEDSDYAFALRFPKSVRKLTIDPLLDNRTSSQMFTDTANCVCVNPVYYITGTVSDAALVAEWIKDVSASSITIRLLHEDETVTESDYVLVTESAQGKWVVDLSSLPAFPSSDTLKISYRTLDPVISKQADFAYWVWMWTQIHFGYNVGEQDYSVGNVYAALMSIYSLSLGVINPTVEESKLGDTSTGWRYRIYVNCEYLGISSADELTEEVKNLSNSTLDDYWVSRYLDEDETGGFSYPPYFDFSSALGSDYSHVEPDFSISSPSTVSAMTSYYKGESVEAAICGNYPDELGQFGADNADDDDASYTELDTTWGLYNFTSWSYEDYEVDSDVMSYVLTEQEEAEEVQVVRPFGTCYTNDMSMSSGAISIGDVTDLGWDVLVRSPYLFTNMSTAWYVIDGNYYGSHTLVKNASNPAFTGYSQLSDLDCGLDSISSTFSPYSLNYSTLVTYNREAQHLYVEFEANDQLGGGNITPTTTSSGWKLSTLITWIVIILILVAIIATRKGDNTTSTSSTRSGSLGNTSSNTSKSSNTSDKTKDDRGTEKSPFNEKISGTVSVRLANGTTDQPVNSSSPTSSGVMMDYQNITGSSYGSLGS